jgi:hypothetical protein
MNLFSRLTTIGLLAMLAWPATAIAEDVTIKGVTDDLAKEAQQAWSEKQAWPRKKPNYAEDRKLSLPSEDVINALGRRLDRVPLIDGYIKWQLLSFKPDFEKASERDLQQIIRNLPQLTDQPSMDRRTQRAVAIGQKDNVPREVVLDLVKAVNEYEQGIKENIEANEATVRYRDAVIAKLPHEDGLRLLARLQDGMQRYQAGHPSYRSVISTAVREAEQLKKDPALDRRARMKLLAMAKQLQNTNSRAIENLNVMASGKVQIKKYRGIFRRHEGDQLTSYLMGKDWEDPKKKKKKKK